MYSLRLRKTPKKSFHEQIYSLCFSLTFSPGLEEFEDKIDKIAGGNADENSWIGNLYNKFKGSFLGNDAIDANTVEMDGLEPPVLDDKWGLGDVASLYDEKNSEYIFTLKMYINSETLFTVYWRLRDKKGKSNFHFSLSFHPTSVLLRQFHVTYKPYNLVTDHPVRGRVK